MNHLLIKGLFVLAVVFAGCSDKANVGVDESSTSSSSDVGSGSNFSDSNSTISGDLSDSGVAGDGGSKYGSSDNLKSVYFGFDKFSVDGSNLDAVKDNANVILATQYSQVRVQGNTDEWGSDEYNYALSLKRASSVKDVLVRNGVPSEKIKLVSYGESKPKCLEKTKECWQENRRVDFVLSK